MGHASRLSAESTRGEVETQLVRAMSVTSTAIMSLHQGSQKREEELYTSLDKWTTELEERIQDHIGKVMQIGE